MTVLQMMNRITEVWLTSFWWAGSYYQIYQDTLASCWYGGRPPTETERILRASNHQCRMLFRLENTVIPTADPPFEPLG